VFYREANRIGGKGTERVYYVVFKKDGLVIEEKAGRQFADDMTPARAVRIRSERIEGKRMSRKEIKAKKEALKAAEEGKWTIDRLWNRYKRNRSDNKGLATDSGRYEKYIKAQFGNKEPKDIILLDIERLSRRLSKELSPQTVKHVLNLLTWIINYGVKNGFCEGLTFKIKKPAVNNLKTEDLTHRQLENLLKAIEEDANIQIKNLMKIALVSGMRRGELFKLKWDDIDVDRGFITILDPKGGKDQKIPLNESARDILLNHPETGSNYVFPGQNGKQRVTASVGVNRIKKRAGLPADFRPFHGLRHVFASTLASSGKVDMYTLQKLLTHKSPIMTQRYAHLRDDALKRASELAGRLIQRASKDKKNVLSISDHKE